MLVKKNITIGLPVEQVFPYVLDFSQLYEWDDHVIQGRRIDVGPVKVGSRFQFVYSLAGQIQTLDYTLAAMETNRFVRLECNAPAFQAIDEITFQSAGAASTRVTYQAEIRVNSRIKDFLLRPIMNRIGDRVVHRLKEVLETPEIRHPTGRPLNVLNVPYRFSAKGWNHRRKQFRATRAHPGTILITGPTSGIGRSAAFSLAGKGCNLILVGRNETKLKSLEKELRQRNFEKEVHRYTCDMQDLNMVNRMCDQIRKDQRKIDVIINNAGALFSEARSMEGVERTTVVDLIAPWILCCRLLGQINSGGCMINVSSGGMYGSRLNISELKNPKVPFSGPKAYAAAKRAMHVFSAGLNAEIESSGIRIHCMHPGWANTPGVLSSLPKFHTITKRWLRTSFQGADTIVWLAMHNPLPGGKFWLDRRIQPDHILRSTLGKENDYKELRTFLDAFAKPDMG
jgi:short-subunit dehydrogenase